MKSILQMDRETQLDRQRRYLFCQYFYGSYWNALEGVDVDSLGQLKKECIMHNVENEAIRRFANCLSDQYYPYWYSVPDDLREGVRRWFCRVGELPEELRADNPKMYIPPHEVSTDNQETIASWMYLFYFKMLEFVIKDEDKTRTAAEQAAAQEKLRQLSTMPHGL